MLSPLPIDPHLDRAAEVIAEGRPLVLVAEPGAGKTTRVPPAIQRASGGEVWVVEPRRIAARSAAARVAAELGTKVGGRVGYTVRFDDRSGPSTTLRFVTEGILRRRLSDDPTLRGLRAVVFDEFHERSLDADIGLALARRAALARRGREPLDLVVMSATMDPEPVAKYLGGEVLRVDGRQHPVDIEHQAHPDRRPLEVQVRAAVQKLVVQGAQGDVLVFLPGMAEIRRAQGALDGPAAAHDLELVVLHGDLPAKDQTRALRSGDRRRVILATNVAETSVTVPGVVAVVDSGLARRASHSPWTGLPTLEVRPVSQASCIQRAGRAGRTGPGRCLRLFTAHDFSSRPSFEAPEIARADLSEVVLELFSLAEDPRRFPFLEAPPPASLDAALAVLDMLRAVRDGELTDEGRAMHGLRLPPRLAKLVLDGAGRGIAREAAVSAAILSEGSLRRRDRSQDVRVGTSDVAELFSLFAEAEGEGLSAASLRRLELDERVVRAVVRASRSVLSRVRDRADPPATIEETEERLGLSILSAFGDRVGARRGGEVVFAQGGAAKMARESVVREADWLVAVDVQERDRGGRLVRLAQAIEPEWLIELFEDRLDERRQLVFDEHLERVMETHVLAYGGLILDESRRKATGPAAEALFVAEAMRRGLAAFVDADELDSLRRRIHFAEHHAPPEDRARFALDEDRERQLLQQLAAAVEDFAQLRGANPLALLSSHLDLRALERWAPERVPVPGLRAGAVVHYEEEQAPWIEARIQDFFGLTQTPAIAHGRAPLVLRLLAPNDRPVQVTSDLPGFWERHYPALRRELMRRYTRHFFPEEPRSAPARRIKPR